MPPLLPHLAVLRVDSGLCLPTPGASEMALFPQFPTSQRASPEWTAPPSCVSPAAPVLAVSNPGVIELWPARARLSEVSTLVRMSRWRSRHSLGQVLYITLTSSLVSIVGSFFSPFPSIPVCMLSHLLVLFTTKAFLSTLFIGH